MDRRDFLKYSATSVALTGLGLNEVMARNLVYDPSLNYKGQSNHSNQNSNNQLLPQNNQRDFWSQPRRIYVQRQQTGEKAQLFYWANGMINQEHYWLASYLMRDVRQQKMIYMDVRLLDLLTVIQAWLTYFGHKNPIVITSGYRTAKTNSSLEGAAKNSMHLQGKAIDFTIPGLSVRDVGKIASHFQAGGVGIYPSRNFIHLDTGRVRTWTR